MGKSYIGQSVHCGKRLDEYYAGKQFIDEVIQIEGVESFSFEILKTVKKEELSFWEDYFIIKYDTMYPKGYNKRWNCNEEDRKKIQKMVGDEPGLNQIINNKGTLKFKNRDELPIVLEDGLIRKINMRLYIYLFSIAKYSEVKDSYLFLQKDFTINKIHEFLKIHNDSIKKYWRILEDSNLIVYNGDMNLKNAPQKEWGKIFMQRKKSPTCGYYIKVDKKAKMLPVATINQIQTQLQISEEELKLYLLLINLQTRTLYNKENCLQMTLRDLCKLKGLENHQNNKKKIVLQLLWLKTIGLIDYSIDKISNNFGEETAIINLKEVNYYTKGGELGNLLEQERTFITDEVKNEILNSKNLVKFEDLN